MCRYLLVLLVTGSTSIVGNTNGSRLPLEDQSTDDAGASVLTKSHDIYHQHTNTESNAIVRKQGYSEIDRSNPMLKSTDLIPLKFSNEFIKSEGNKMVYKFEDEASNVLGKSVVKLFLAGAAGPDSWIWKLIPKFNFAYLKDYRDPGKNNDVIFSNPGNFVQRRKAGRLKTKLGYVILITDHRANIKIILKRLPHLITKK